MPQTLRDYRRLFRTFINRAQADRNFVQGDDIRTDVLGHLVDAAIFLDNFTTLLMLGEKKRTDAHDFIDLLRHGLKLDGQNGSMLTRSSDPDTENEAIWAEESAEFLNAALRYLEVDGPTVCPGDMLRAADDDDGGYVAPKAAKPKLATLQDGVDDYLDNADRDADDQEYADEDARHHGVDPKRRRTGANDLIKILQVLVSQGSGHQRQARRTR